MDFQPDYRNIVAAARNERPRRLPLYEHLVNPPSMARVLGQELPPIDGDDADRKRHMALACAFWREMTYDCASFEVCVTEILPDGGALLGERDGVIQGRDDFERYPWGDLPRLFWAAAGPRGPDASLAGAFRPRFKRPTRHSPQRGGWHSCSVGNLFPTAWRATALVGSQATHPTTEG
ncbi:MAG: hypothetical protein KGY99_09860 [Phycisphaerae bacterium]|nr:hypothetical protein [Phycisphaerae bacterium]